MQNWTIIADDLTGAGDAGVSFARRGLATRVAFSAKADFGGARVRVVTTESRALAEAEAILAVEQAVFDLRLGTFSRIYKKIDSTLRGHPGAELAAIMRAAEIKSALVCPAFPQQGRLVRDGWLWVRGVRLDETEFARSASQADVMRVFGQQFIEAGACRGIGVESIRRSFGRLVEVLQKPGVYIADAETDEDLALLAQAARRAGVGLLCGSAGLARAVAETLPPGTQSARLLPQNRAAMVIAGSRSPVTRRQVETAREAGIIVLSPEIDALRIVTAAAVQENAGDAPGGRETGSGIAAQIAAHVSAGSNVVVSAAESGLLPGAEAVQAAARFAEGLAGLAKEVLAAVPLSGLVLTGGETAAAVFRALGCASFDLGGEVQPGVVWGRLADGAYAGLPVVTKAGGFGEANTLVEAVRFLRSPV